MADRLDQPAGAAKAPQRILIVDDEDIVVRSTVRILEGAGHLLTTARDATEALRELAQAPFDLAILDIMMPGIDGIELLRRIKEAYPDTEVIMFTGLAQVATAVDCMKLGAIDYVSKPFDPDQLRVAVSRALEHRALRRQNESLGQTPDARFRLDRMVGQSPAMQQLFRLIAQCAATNSTVLLTGESGTGKELVAQAIHHNSLRSGGPFVAVDCSSLSEQLLESELFGHARGAFSGAVSRKKGMVEVAAVSYTHLSTKAATLSKPSTSSTRSGRRRRCRGWSPPDDWSLKAGPLSWRGFWRIPRPGAAGGHHHRGIIQGFAVLEMRLGPGSPSVTVHSGALPG